MRKRITLAITATAAAGGLALGMAGPAAAGHCADLGKPGNSDFAEHVKASNGPGPHNEGQHRGWSTCEPNSANFGQ